MISFLAQLSAQQPKGAELYKSGDYLQAASVLESELKSSEGNAERGTHWATPISRCQHAIMPSNSLRHFSFYLKERPSDEDVLYAFARTDAQLAEMSLQRIFRLDPNSARASDACDSLRIWNRLGWRPSSNMRRLPRIRSEANWSLLVNRSHQEKTVEGSERRRIRVRRGTASLSG